MCGVLIIILYVGMCYQYNKQLFYNDKIHIQIQNKEDCVDALTAKMLQTHSVEYNTNFCFSLWTQEEGRVRHCELEKEEIVSVIALCGRSDLLVQSERSLDVDDTYSCIIGRKTAEKLFGEYDVIGLKICYDEKLYNIVDVLDVEKSVFIYEAQNKDDVFFDRVVIKKDIANSSRIVFQNFQNIYNIKGKLIDYELWNCEDRFIVLIVPFIIVVYWLYNGHRRVSNKNNYIKSIMEVIIYFLIFGVILVFAFNMDIPQEYIPAQWSDRMLWREISNLWLEENFYLVCYEKCLPDALMVESSLWILGLYIGIVNVLCVCLFTKSKLNKI